VGNKSPFSIRLSGSERRELEGRLKRYTQPHCQIQRARMILLAAEDLTNEEISRRLGVRRESVCLWRKRFFHERLDGLNGRPRTGRPKRSNPRAESQ
jgi:transposase